MPQYRNPFEKGDLYIKFDVQFPENNWINPDKLSVSWFTVLIMQIMWLSLLLPLTPPCFLCVFSLSLLCFIVGSLPAPWAGLVLMAIPLSQSFDNWDYRCDRPLPALLRLTSC